MRSSNSFISRRQAIWPTLNPSVHSRSRSEWIPFPLDQESCRIYSKARHAIWNACTTVGLGELDTVLVPAYHHGSEVEALLKVGLNIKYYEVNDALEPDPKDLERLLEPNVKALYLIHYLGFPQDASFWRQWCDQRNLLLIEDAAQAFLAMHEGQAVGSFGHISVFCLYKTYGLPDGGAVFSVRPPVPPAQRAKIGLWPLCKRHLNWVAARRAEIGLLHQLIKPVFAWWKRINEQPHAEFDLGNPYTPPSLMTTYLLPKIVSEGTAQIRRDNYNFLLEHLHDLVPRPFSLLPEGACPFAFPIEVGDAKLFLSKLRQKGVLGLLFWINPHPSLPVEEFPRSRALRENLLALPVHQELTKNNLFMIVNAVRECLESKSEIVVSAV
ncbi:DegT/DnrJ/EryC1/StrS family aminotransferase [Pontibacter litorisediminis]|uniref:DegT/DnrJ/EryC1/StrS family aminotransferase n=1 Tax=Pontibacter litorisediminis TaxID=1846260 RepID=UPI0023EC92CC|nr:DegT/DnrJ/EryC1/StrS family aminotransferase [Pontibacter litorisediminis]